MATTQTIPTRRILDAETRNKLENLLREEAAIRWEVIEDKGLCHLFTHLPCRREVEAMLATGYVR